MPKVFIVNKSIHDFSAAKDFGKIVYLSEGMVSRYNTTQIFRQVWHYLKVSDSNDYILITGLSVINSIACTIFGLLHNRLNLLIHDNKNNTYQERKLDFSAFINNKGK